MVQRVLFIDAYDSFTNNITSQLAAILPTDCIISVLHIDTDISASNFAHELRQYDAVICGPGPGSPDNLRDVGLMRQVFAGVKDGAAGSKASTVPVFGICLGFQVLVREFGGRIERLGKGLHGIVHAIDHIGEQSIAINKDIFENVAPFTATLYHSLHANIGQSLLPENGWTASRWLPTSSCRELVPLAWTKSEDDARILMAVRHATLPFWAVQYHPESVCTEAAGLQVLKNWFAAALAWNMEHRANWSTTEISQGLSQKHTNVPLGLAIRRKNLLAKSWQSGEFEAHDVRTRTTYSSKSIPLPPHLSPPDIVEILGFHGDDTEQIILDSSSARARQDVATGASDQRGRFSIIALDIASALRISHKAETRTVNIHQPFGRDDTASEDITIQLNDGEDVWAVVSRYWARLRSLVDLPHNVDHKEIPFRGGFMGYVTYEMGLSGIAVHFERFESEETRQASNSRSDLCFVWVEKSLVLDHFKGCLTLQSLGGNEDTEPTTFSWIDNIISKLQTSNRWLKSIDTPIASSLTTSLPPVTINTPESSKYQSLVGQCQEFIAAGESYELCLTAQTTLQPETPTGPPVPAWTLYRHLRQCQPAPFGSFIRLHTDGSPILVSSSPERFLTHSADGLCQMHPMKGTVRKIKTLSDGTVSYVSRSEAETILQTPKERAENLMIVDLVRHDLHGVCGAGKVDVPVLMRVEEYASVFQMVTIVEGQLGQLGQLSDGTGHEKMSTTDLYTGFDVLAASLPPGSMTGAPKKRSCEILLGMEDHKRRSLYSGVVGYMDVTGRGDWSVTIRTLFKWGGEDERQWSIGAGGAVTTLSSPLGEYEEMMTKLSGPIGVFG